MGWYNILWYLLAGLGILNGITIMIAQLSDKYPNFTYWCQDTDPHWQFIRRIGLYLIGISLVIRGMNLLGMFVMVELLQKWAERWPQLTSTARIGENIINWISWCIAAEVGLANDRVAAKAWMSQQICSLSGLELYSLAEWLKIRANILLGPLT